MASDAAGKQDRTYPLVALRALHARQGQLCNMVERLADALPSVETKTCLATAWAVTTVIGPLHVLEEEAFFPLLERRLPTSSGICSSTSRSRQEHAEDRDAATEVISNLKWLVDGCSRQEIDLVAYQLRAFFVALRRHEAREIEVMFQQAAKMFTDEDQSDLAAALKRCLGKAEHDWSGLVVDLPSADQFPETW